MQTCRLPISRDFKNKKKFNGTRATNRAYNVQAEGTDIDSRKGPRHISGGQGIGISTSAGSNTSSLLNRDQLNQLESSLRINISNS